MNKQQLLERLDEAWVELKAAYAGVPEAQLAEPGAVGEWSVKDILAHVCTWEEEALKYLPLILAGGRLPRYKAMYGGIDAFNALMTEQKRRLSLDEVLRQMDDIHRQLIDLIRAAPDDQFTRETRFRRRIKLDTYGHYPIHTQAIREWRARSGG